MGLGLTMGRDLDFFNGKRVQYEVLVQKLLWSFGSGKKATFVHYLTVAVSPFNLISPPLSI